MRSLSVSIFLPDTFLGTEPTLYCLLRYSSHGSGLSLRLHETSGFLVAKRIV